MIVHDLDVVGLTVFPPEADPPLVVDANAVLTRAISVKLLQTIAGED